MLNQFKSRQLPFNPTPELISAIAPGWEQYFYDRLYMETTKTSLNDLNRPKWALLVGGGAEMMMPDPKEQSIKARMLLLRLTPAKQKLYEKVYSLFMKAYAEQARNNRSNLFGDFGVRTILNPHSYEQCVKFYNLYLGAGYTGHETPLELSVALFKDLAKAVIDAYNKKHHTHNDSMMNDSSKELRGMLDKNPKLASLTAQFSPELSKAMFMHSPAILKAFQTINEATQVAFLIKFAAAKGVVISALPTVENKKLDESASLNISRLK